MSSFFTKITDAVGDVGGTVKKGLGHARNELIGRFDADRMLAKTYPPARMLIALFRTPRRPS